MNTLFSHHQINKRVAFLPVTSRVSHLPGLWILLGTISRTLLFEITVLSKLPLPQPWISSSYVQIYSSISHCKNKPPSIPNPCSFMQLLLLIGKLLHTGSMSLPDILFSTCISQPLPPPGYLPQKGHQGLPGGQIQRGRLHPLFVLFFISI